MHALFRALFCFAFLLSFADTADSQSPPPAPKTLPPPAPTPNLNKEPMIFYVARGDPDACGPGCNEWIAAEGYIDPAASQRFRSFLNRSRVANLPIYFHSPGGIAAQAIAIGLLMREREMTAGVSRTVVEGCKSMIDQECRAWQRSGQRMTAALKATSACNSACVYALIGAKTRQVPPSAQLGVHSGKLVRIFADGRVVAASKNDRDVPAHTQLRRYIKDMGIDLRLLEIASSTPHEGVRFLTRDEIASLGIDRREFLETHWDQEETKPAAIFKLVVDSGGLNGKERRLSIIGVTCTAPGRIVITYLRGLRSDESATRRVVSLIVSDQNVLMRGPVNAPSLNASEIGGPFEIWSTSQPLNFLELLGKHDSIALAISGLSGSTPSTAAVTRLTTTGLSRAIDHWRQSQMCLLVSGSETAKPFVPPLDQLKRGSDNGGWVVRPPLGARSTAQ